MEISHSLQSHGMADTQKGGYCSSQRSRQSWALQKGNDRLSVLSYGAKRPFHSRRSFTFGSAAFKAAVIVASFTVGPFSEYAQSWALTMQELNIMPCCPPTTPAAAVGATTSLNGSSGRHLRASDGVQDNTNRMEKIFEEEARPSSSDYSDVEAAGDGIAVVAAAAALPPSLTRSDEGRRKFLADLRNWRDILGVVIIGVACAVAVAAGTGGGSIYVPIMTLVMGFAPHSATVISQSLMCGGVLAGTFLNLCRRHPLVDRPLVDLDLVIFLAPAQMAGVSFGMVINRCLPAWLLVAALVVVLSVAVVQTIRQYNRCKKAHILQNPSGSPALAVPEAGDAMRFVDDEDPLSMVRRISSKVLEPQEPTASLAEAAGPAAGHKLCVPSKRNAVALRKTHATAGCEGNCDEEGSSRGIILPSTADDSFRGAPDVGEELAAVAAEDMDTQVWDNEGCALDREEGQLGDSKRDGKSQQGPAAGETAVDDSDSTSSAGGVPAGGDLVAIAPAGDPDSFSRARISKLKRARMKLREMQHRHGILKWFLIAAIWLVDMSLGIIHGEKGSPVGLVPYCGWAYWVLYVSSAAALLGCSYFQGILLHRIQRGRDKAAIQRVAGDLHFDFATVHLFFMQTILAGLIAGIVGIGSALVMGPIMLTKGMLPVVCSAVNTALVLCSSSSAAVKSLLGTAAPLDYCAFLFCLCFVCAIIGKAFVDRVVRKYDADHLLILFLIIIMFASMGCMVAAGIIGLVHNVGQTFKSPCS